MSFLGLYQSLYVVSVVFLGLCLVAGRGPVVVVAERFRIAHLFRDDETRTWTAVSTPRFNRDQETMGSIPMASAEHMANARPIYLYHEPSAKPRRKEACRDILVFNHGDPRGVETSARERATRMQCLLGTKAPHEGGWVEKRA